MLYWSKEAAKSSILYSYKHGFSGFAAKLTESQAEDIAGTVTCIKTLLYLVGKSLSGTFNGIHPWLQDSQVLFKWFQIAFTGSIQLEAGISSVSNMIIQQMF